MPQILETAHLVDEHRMSEVQVGCGRVKSGLYDEWPPGLEPGFQLTLNENIDRTAPDFCELLFYCTHIAQKSGGVRGSEDKRFRDRGHESATAAVAPCGTIRLT